MLVIHCLRFIIRASNDEKKHEVNQACDIYERIKAMNDSEEPEFTIPLLIHLCMRR